ncbi:MAG: hypothetical protein Q8M02_01725 [Candidatus Didemnitutus sp.]|nr:hypothetical protein [Candidatus Didemnitutus sp.]
MPYLRPSKLVRLPVWLLFAVGLVGTCAQAKVVNMWPFWVKHVDEITGSVTAQQTLGPLFEARRAPDGATTQIWRPIYIHHQNGERETTHLLYPFFSWHRDGDRASFSFFQLINQHRDTNVDGTPRAGFDVWPFYFSRETGDPATSYRALLPVAGTIKHRFGKDELSWAAFPLYLRVAQGEKRTHYTPWPFVRHISGGGHAGFELWPLAGNRARAGEYREQFFLWPLIYRQERKLSDPVPERRVGMLPFYTRESGTGYVSENFLWPFFGYTDRTAPQRYHETRYLWPFLVQGRGAERHVNRWAPFYSHSVVKGYDKQWVLWPLLRHARWQDGVVAQERSQLLIFLYWSNEQRSLTNPSAAPAYKKHFWPLVSVWDNGAGRRQWQMLSPLEVFFPHNDTVRQVYTPLLAIFRYDHRAADDVRWSFLWNAVSRTQSPRERAFHVGPLFSSAENADGARIALGAGLLSWRRAPSDRRWQFSLFDFRSARAKNSAADVSP